jgi:hypothetical protein
MKLLLSHKPRGPHTKRGAVLLLSFLVLMVIIAIVYQLNRVTATDQLVANRDFTSTNMDLAIESAMLEVFEQLRSDGELRQAGGEDDGAAAAAAAAGAGQGGGGEGGEESADASDSFMDEWAQQAATSFNDLELRILIVDEDRKYNILNMLAEDPDEAQEAFDRVVKILDLCREDTEFDIQETDADDMARIMREHLLERDNSYLPRPGELLSFDEESRSRGMPLSIREFVVLEPFTEDHYRDSFDRDGNRVHAIDAFLTMYTSPTTGESEGPEAATSTGGYSVNVNTAPRAVLTGLMSYGDMDPSFWEDVVSYRNDEEEPDLDQEPVEPSLDEFGEEILATKIFDSLEELAEVRGYDMITPESAERMKSLLRVDSDVFSIYVTARMVTLADRHQSQDFDSRQEKEEYERSGAHMTRTARCVVWRRMGEEDVDIIPLLRWEVLDHSPLPILDYPDGFHW